MQTGQTLDVPGYQVVQYLGSGARSTIWQIRDRRTSQLYALKRVVKRNPSDAKFLQQADNEYAIATRLDHPVIRKIHDIRRIKRWMSVREIQLVMEHCSGTNLQDQRPEDVQEVVRIFEQVAHALVHMNAQGFVHADMKPNNVLVASDGTVKIIDLGQSCEIGTVKERIQGTPDFIAPEQVHRRPLDGRTDVFNFGASMYWTLTGKPIPTVLPKNSVQFKSESVLTAPDQVNPDVPKALSKLVTDCVEPLPSNRPGSMKEVSSRLGLIAHTLSRNAAEADADKRATGEDLGG